MFWWPIFGAIIILISTTTKKAYALPKYASTNKEKEGLLQLHSGGVEMTPPFFWEKFWHRKCNGY